MRLTAVQNDFANVLKQAWIDAVKLEREDAWLRRSEIVERAYNQHLEVNANHRAALHKLVQLGCIKERLCTHYGSQWYEYRWAD